MGKEIFERKKEQLLMLNWESHIPQLVAGFTTKNGGVSESDFTSFNLGLHVNDKDSAVVGNRRILSEILDFPTSNWACSDQVHDNKIVKVTKEHVGNGVFEYETSIKKTDGVYTKEPNILLTLCYADCVPLYFCAPKYKLIGMAHAGWKGTVKDIAGEMVRKWKEQEGVEPAEIHAAIGPSIGDCCYVVDDYVINFVNKVLNEKDTPPYSIISEGQYSLNLKELNRLLMMKAGIPAANIQVSSYCTSCDKELFFSHRRDKGKTGRMMSFIGRKED
ncbi:YfiH family protein [Evansella vedderi]|uniref:Purine nucleoside phosphorylase n=1 Tax=Evansella vedderi TaxID=38282 RepID=A0ABU0A4P4_9BACI|nr:peptidoglycan editing factor PgeF [Evansella vedderi]MDQ0257305.1 YfiH family protein [Evansella vedderi]